MHPNSIIHRSLLRETNNHPLLKARREPHRDISLAAKVPAGEGQVGLDVVRLLVKDQNSAVERLVARDLGDFLGRLGVKQAENAPYSIHLEIGGVPEGFICDVSSTRTVLQAADSAALWAGHVHLENMLRANRGAALTLGVTRRVPAWGLQVSAPAWGANLFVPDLSEEYLSEDSFRLMAHHGIDGLLLYGDLLCYATGTNFPELHHPEAERHLEMLREATERALPYGIRFYYVPVAPRLRPDHPLLARLPEVRGAHRQQWEGEEAVYYLCSSHPEVLGFYAQWAGGLFAAAPEMGGLILIVGGESYYHCYMRAHDSGKGETNCVVCARRKAEEVVAGMVQVTTDAVKAAVPHARVFAWPYSAQSFWSHDPNTLPLLDTLAPETGFLSEIDNSQIYWKQGATRSYPKSIWDYSIDFVGQSDKIIAQTLHCRRQNRELMIKTESAVGIELLHFPFVPCLQRLGEKWQSVRALGPQAVLQRWGFSGVIDAVTDRLAYEARWNPAFAPESSAHDIAGIFCGEAAGEVVEAWRACSAAVGHIPLLTTPDYYLGPMFLGPTHPLPVWEDETPGVFWGDMLYLLEHEPTFSTDRPNVFKDMVFGRKGRLYLDEAQTPYALIEEEYASALLFAEKGWNILHGINGELLRESERAEVEEQELLAENLYRTFLTMVHTLRFLAVKEEGDTAEMQRLAHAELENAVAARTMYVRAPWLNHALRTDITVPDSLEMLGEKIRLLEAYLK